MLHFCLISTVYTYSIKLFAKIVNGEIGFFSKLFNLHRLDIKKAHR